MFLYDSSDKPAFARYLLFTVSDGPKNCALIPLIVALFSPSCKINLAGIGTASHRASKE